MKMQLGMLYRDQRQATEEDLQTLLDVHVTSKPGTSGEVYDHSLLMAYRGDRITLEEDSEIQPICIGPYVLTFDGRLDNREEIAEGTGLAVNNGTPDPLIILTAYAQQGNAIFTRLIGEFALTVWNRKMRALEFARSIDGARPLYYVCDNEKLIWASDFTHLVHIADVDPRVNEEYVREFLIGKPRPTSCPFETVEVIPPGNVLRFTNNGFSPMQPLWDWGRVRSIHCASDADYEAQLLDKMTEAVRVRLRAKGRVFCELSGGLDSSSIALLADRILRDKNAAPETLRTISCVYSQSETCDESYFIRLIEEKRGVPSIYVHEEEQAFCLGLNKASFTGLPNIFDTCPGRFPTFRGHMQTHGADVLLTGFGGDHIFGNHPDATPLVAEHLYAGHLRTAHRECQEWSRFLGVPYFRLFFLQALPLLLGTLIRSDAPCKPLQSAPPAWVRDRREPESEASLPAVGKKFARPTPSRRYQTAVLQSLFDSICTGQWNGHGDIYVSHPYTHRPLLEWCLGVPLSQFLRNGETRSLMRRAMREILPPRVLLRKGKGSIYEPYARALAREWTGLRNIEKWEICRRGYAVPERFKQSLNELRCRLAEGMIPALRALMMEGWFRSLRHLSEQRGRNNRLEREQSALTV